MLRNRRGKKNSYNYDPICINIICQNLEQFKTLMISVRTTFIKTTDTKADVIC